MTKCTAYVSKYTDYWHFHICKEYDLCAFIVWYRISTTCVYVYNSAIYFRIMLHADSITVLCI